MPKDTLHVTKNSGKINEGTFFKKTPENSKYICTGCPKNIQHCERSELRLHFEWTKVN